MRIRLEDENVIEASVVKDIDHKPVLALSITASFEEIVISEHELRNVLQLMVCLREGEIQ